MSVRLFDADNNIVAMGKSFLSFADCHAYSIAFVVKVTDYLAIVIYDIPSVETFIPVYMDSGVCAGCPSWL